MGPTAPPPRAVARPNAARSLGLRYNRLEIQMGPRRHTVPANSARYAWTETETGILSDSGLRLIERTDEDSPATSIDRKA